MAAPQGIITSVSSDAGNATSGGRGARLRELRNRSTKDEEGSAGQQQEKEKEKEPEVDHAQTATNTGTIGTMTTTTTTGTGATTEKASLNPETPVTTSLHEKEDDDAAVKTQEGQADEKQSSSSPANGAKSKQGKETKTGEKSSPSASSTKAKQKEGDKPSFFASLIRILLPCIGPSKAHDLDLDVPPSQPSKPPNTASPAKESEKPTAADLVPTPSREKPTPPPLTTGDSLPLVPAQTASPPTPILVSGDKEVIIPPTPPPHTLPESETGGVMSSSVQAPGSTGEEGEEYTDEGEGEEGNTTRDTGVTGGTLGYGMSEEEEEERLILQGGAGIPLGPDGEPRPLLPNVFPNHVGRKCLVLDLDETLVHSSFKLIPQADYVVPVEIEHQFHNVYVIKRPGVDQFLQKMGELYEVVVFTASLSKYADPVLDKLDTHQTVSHRLFRESCFNHKGNYVKDLSQLGRPISQTIILDNSPASYLFHPNNAVPVSSWFNDPHDTELMDLCPFLGDLRSVDDVRGVLDGGL